MLNKMPTPAMGGGGSSTASGTSFDNTTAQLPNNPDNVQNAIEEVNDKFNLSESEIVIGKYVKEDGTIVDLYRKVLRGTRIGEADAIISKGTVTDVNKIRKISGICYKTSDQWLVALPYVIPTSPTQAVVPYTWNGDLYLRTMGIGNFEFKYEIIIDYFKD